MFGHGSPARGVVVGPLRMTSQLLQLFHDVVRNSLHAGDAVLDRETVDDLELHLAGLHLIGEEVFEDVLRRLGDDRSDAIAAADADRDDRELIVVDDVL